MDYYELLGVSRSAAPPEIKAAYRRTVRRYHPDVNHSAGAGERAAMVNAAYETLMDRRKRQRYDDLLCRREPRSDRTGFTREPEPRREQSRSAYADCGAHGCTWRSFTAKRRLIRLFARLLCMGPLLLLCLLRPVLLLLSFGGVPAVCMVGGIALVMLLFTAVTGLLIPTPCWLLTGLVLTALLIGILLPGPCAKGTRRLMDFIFYDM